MTDFWTDVVLSPHIVYVGWRLRVPPIPAPTQRPRPPPAHLEPQTSVSRAAAGDRAPLAHGPCRGRHALSEPKKLASFKLALVPVLESRSMHLTMQTQSMYSRRGSHPREHSTIRCGALPREGFRRASVISRSVAVDSLPAWRMGQLLPAVAPLLAKVEGDVLVLDHVPAVSASLRY
jgi:hypothetical protein